MILAAMAALVLFVSLTRYVSSVNSQVAPTVVAYQATKEISAYSLIEEDAVEAVQVPQRYAAASLVPELEQLTGRRVSFNVAEGTYIGSDMLLAPSSLNPDEREIALTVDAKTGIAGRVEAGDFVDVYAEFLESDQSSAGSSLVLVRNARVVSVGGVETRSEANSADELEQQEVLPVTLALEPEDALRVTNADAFAQQVRLVGLPPGIDSQDRGDEPDGVRTEDLADGSN